MAFEDRITVGADPEFGFLNSVGDSVYAGEVMTQDLDGQFGLDGSDEVAELRPTHDVNPIRVVRNIREVLKSGLRRNRELSEYTWKAGSMVGNYPIGGHIHFGWDGTPSDLDSWFDVGKVMEAMDTYAAQIIMLLESRGEFRARLQTSYGGLGNYRQQAWGWEYRVLGSWLASPRIAAGVLALSKTVYCDALGRNRDAGRGHRLVDADIVPNSDDYRAANYRLARSRYTRLRDEVREMDGYRTYKRYIDFLFRLIESERTWFPRNPDMKATWKLDEESVARPRIGEKSLRAIWRGYTRNNSSRRRRRS